MNQKCACVIGVIMVSALMSAGSAGAVIPQTEREALIAIYNNTGGPGWDDSTNWMGAVGTECTWFGVTCSVGEANVIELGLVGNNLVGGIPAEIADLSQLEVIYVGWNQLMGSIPAEIGSLTSLLTLAMPGNQLLGSIPPELGNLSSLEWLNLRRNQLTGSIPPELGSLANLLWFNVSRNRLAGNIPAELGGLVSLQEFHVWDNRFSGSIPTALASLPGLAWFDASGNRLTGPIPPEFASCANLNGLLLSGNMFGGEVPPELGSLSALGMLDLSGNQLTGSLPPELGNLANLGFLGLADNRLSGAIPPEIGNLSALTDLFLQGNLFEGVIPPEIGNLTSLGQLHLQGNNLTGPVPSELGNLTAIGHLDLSNNHLSGAIPAEIGSLGTLGFLSLQGNILTGQIPAAIGSLVNLGELFLGWNRIEGPIPPEIGALTSLWNLDLTHNRLSGQIPSEIGNLGNLQWLHLGSNNLTGPVPSTITNLTSLVDNENNITMNGLYSGDPGVVAFLDGKCGPDWKLVQTVMPTGFSVIGSTGQSVTLGWDPIGFNWKPGGYDIFVSESPSGPFVRYARAVDKSANTWTIFDLLPNTTYSFKICSITEADPENMNTVVSELTPPVATATTAAPSIWYASTTGSAGNDCVSPATPCASISMALELAAPGEMVVVAPGTYTEILHLDEPVMIVGGDPATTIIEGYGWGPVVDVTSFTHARLSGLTIRNGQVEFGGGVFVAWRGHLELHDALVTMNTAQQGGGVYVDCEGSASLDHVTITGNTANQRGGGLAACGWFDLVDSTVTENTAPWGGGIAVFGQAMIERTTVADNTATDFGGGGVVNEGWLTIADSAIVGNSASVGGGVANMQWANLAAENTTLSSNQGGGLFNDLFGSAGLDGCTVAGNTDTESDHSGVMNWDTVAIHSTIIAGNTPYNCANPVTSYGYNLESGHDCDLNGPGDVSGADPLLGPPADNGGATWTHALGAGSPAIDAGDPVAFFATDQRGVPRPLDGDFDGIPLADVGAVEMIVPLFSDDFESGDTTAWTAVSP